MQIQQDAITLIITILRTQKYDSRNKNTLDCNVM